MKKLLCLLLASMPVAMVFAQKGEQKLPKLSPLTQSYIQKAKKLASGEHVDNYVYKHGANNSLYVTAMVKMSNNAGNAERDMEKLGVHIGTKAGDIWTAQVPVKNVEPFTQVRGIEYIQLDEPAYPTLDKARKTTRVDSVHKGINLFCPFTGDGVIVGIIDAGFDYTHPTFFDSNYAHYRVNRVWEQKNSSGTPPANFLYGNEITDTVAMWAKGNDNGGTHGTHVGGIAAGSGAGTTSDVKQFRGMAYMSELVFVGITPEKGQWVNTGVSDMIDGMSYIYNYAQSVGKPAIINLSWGSPLGPRDGSSLFSQACNNLLGDPGKIFSCSAGNNGDNNIHIAKTFTATDTVVRTFLTIANSPAGQKTWVDIWGDPGKNFCAQIKLYAAGVAIDSTDYICLDNAMHNEYMIGTNGDTCFVDFTTSSAEFNNKPRIFLDFYSKIAATDQISISVHGNDGTVNFWNTFVYNTSGYYGSFDTYGQPWATSGNNTTTISDIASTEEVITVGAYASKTSFTNVNGTPLSFAATTNDLVDFSSRGPSIDGRVKPDITGPGLTLASAVSSYDPDFQSTGPDYQMVVKNYVSPINSRTYSYGELSGTSMSSPAVSGIVGLMLQANPKLTQQQVKTILAETAIKDAYTGTLPAGGNNNWGNGKVNAYAAVKKTWETNSVKNIATGNVQYELFPNPSNGLFAIDYTSRKTEQATIEVYSVEGKLVHSENWQLKEGTNVKRLDLSGLGKGIYFTRLSGSAGTGSIKTIIH